MNYERETYGISKASRRGPADRTTLAAARTHGMEMVIPTLVVFGFLMALFLGAGVILGLRRKRRERQIRDAIDDEDDDNGE